MGIDIVNGEVSRVHLINVFSVLLDMLFGIDGQSLVGVKWDNDGPSNSSIYFVLGISLSNIMQQASFI